MGLRAAEPQFMATLHKPKAPKISQMGAYSRTLSLPTYGFPTKPPPSKQLLPGGGGIWVFLTAKCNTLPYACDVEIISSNNDKPVFKGIENKLKARRQSVGSLSGVVHRDPPLARRSCTDPSLWPSLVIQLQLAETPPTLRAVRIPDPHVAKLACAALLCPLLPSIASLASQGPLL